MATTSSFSAPATSRNGPMRCRANWRPGTGRRESPLRHGRACPGLSRHCRKGTNIRAADERGRPAQGRVWRWRTCEHEFLMNLRREIAALAPNLRGRLTADAPLAPFTWFRAGGPAELLFQPADEDDLSYLLSRLPEEIPVAVIGLGSNLIIRDGGVKGLVIRLGGKAFGAIDARDGYTLVAGAAAPDAAVARAAAQAGIAGLEFYRGVPGSIGGALRMNAGAHGGETKDVLLSARGVDRAGAK